jgi:hypothetical protein
MILLSNDDGSYNFKIPAEFGDKGICFYCQTDSLARMITLLAMARISFTHVLVGEDTAKIIPHEKVEAFLAIYNISQYSNILSNSNKEANEVQEESIKQAIDILKTVAQVEIVVKPARKDCRFDNL